MLESDSLPPMEPEVSDLTEEWGKVLKSAAETDAAISVSGSERSAKQSAGSYDAPSVALTGKDLRPFVKALGSFACRLARVEPMSDKEAQDIAEPSALVLNKWAPQVAEWVPELTLVTKISDFVESRSEEFKRNKRLPPGSTEPQGPAIAEADAF